MVKPRLFRADLDQTLASASPNRKPLFAVKPVVAFQVHHMTVMREQCVQASIVITRLLVCQAQQFRTQLDVAIWCWFVTITAVIHSTQPTDLAFAHLVTELSIRYIFS
ncbi:MAG: hypothetical protein P4K83_09980 [Terracidiphilus sp.]|nr:hypothetical protein [Terracidiphilus sp.]